MDFERANSIGTGGERLVAETLQRLSVRYDFRQLDNVVLKVGKVTSQIDHLVVDQSGIVIIESKVRNAAHIKGQDSEKNWTACYRGGTYKSFQNPLHQNQWHDTALRQVLRDADISLEPDYIDTLVVFVGADLSGLSLRDAERQRVLDVGQLDTYFERRAAKAEDRAPLMAPFVHDILVVIAGEDRSRDEQTMAAHAAHRAGKAKGTAGPWAGTVPERATPRPGRGSSSRSVLDDLASGLRSCGRSRWCSRRAGRCGAWGRASRGGAGRPRCDRMRWEAGAGHARTAQQIRSDVEMAGRSQWGMTTSM